MAYTNLYAPQITVPGANYAMNPYGNSINWVQGELGARNYPIAPNTSVLLMDQESPKFYIKSADLLGVQTVRSYEYNEVTAGVKPTEPEKTETAQTKPEPKPQNETKADYVSREEFEALKKTIDDLMS